MTSTLHALYVQQVSHEKQTQPKTEIVAQAGGEKTAQPMENRAREETEFRV